MFKDMLKQALSQSEDLQAREPTPAQTAAAVDELPSPAGSPWLKELARHERLKDDASFQQLLQLSNKAVKRLKNEGRKRESKALKSAQSDFVKRLEKATWTAIKRRFAELELSDKAYRSIKQDKLDPTKTLKRLNTRRAEEYRGASAARVREWLKG